jgi:preprotein translocase subunit SecG
MVYGLVLTLHVVVCLLLIIVILVQGGRGGMAEALGGSGSQSLFGGGANIVMTKVTAVGAGLFMTTCLVLALLSAARGRSVIERLPPPAAASGLPLPPAAAPLEAVEVPAPAPPPVAPPATPSSSGEAAP